MEENLGTGTSTLLQKIGKAVGLCIAAILITSGVLKLIGNLLLLLGASLLGKEVTGELSTSYTLGAIVGSTGLIAVGVVTYRKLFPALDKLWKKILLNVGLIVLGLTISSIWSLVNIAKDFKKGYEDGAKAQEQIADDLRAINWEMIATPKDFTKADIESEIRKLKALATAPKRLLAIYEKAEELTPQIKDLPKGALSKQYMISTIKLSEMGSKFLEQYLSMSLEEEPLRDKIKAELLILSKTLQALDGMPELNGEGIPPDIDMMPEAPIDEMREEFVPNPVLGGEEVDIGSCLRVLGKGNQTQQDELMKDISINSDRYPPIIFYMMANVLNKRGMQDDALFWLFAGQIRGFYDALRHQDSRAVNTIEYLNNSIGAEIWHASPIPQEKIKQIAQKAVAWHRQTPENYNPNYISRLSGITSIEVDSTLTPQRMWPETKEEAKEVFVEMLRVNLKTQKARATEN